MTTFLVPVLVFIAIMALGGGVISEIIARRNPLRGRLGKLDEPLDQKSKTSGNGLVVGILSAIGRRVASGGISSRLSADLAKAGFHSRAATGVYLGGKMLLLAIGIGGGIFLLSTISNQLGMAHSLMLTMMGGGIMFFIPNIYLAMRQAGRTREICNYLPDMVDLMEICVSGGMGLDQAWNAVADEFRKVSPLLADEMALTNLELHLGADRATAMRNMAERTGAEDLASLVAVLVQTERFGTSVAQALKVFADNSRQLRSERCEEEAEKMAIKLLFPLIMFIFPVILIIAVGPAAITLSIVLGSG